MARTGRPTARIAGSARGGITSRLGYVQSGPNPPLKRLTSQTAFPTVKPVKLA